MKKCSKCQKKKDLSEFSKNRAAPNGYANQCKICAKETSRASYRRTGHILHRQKQYLRLYGITIEKYNEMFAKQHGRCAICGRHQSEFKRRFDVDHSHKTGKVRELLCHHCNIVLGQVETYYPVMLPYLERHGKMD